MFLYNKEQPKEPQLVGIDLGYGQVKVYSANKKLKFLSAVGIPVSDFGRNAAVADDELIDWLTVTYGGQKYYVGHNAIVNSRNGRFSLRQNKAETNDNIIKLITGLALLTDKEQTYEEFYVVTGLPVLEYKNQKDKLENMMLNGGKPFEFIMHYGDYEVKKKLLIKGVKVISQGEAGFYDYVLNENGELIPSQAGEVSGTVMVVDPGYRTTDVVTMENGKYIEPLSDQFNMGVNQIHQELIKLIMNEFNIKKELKDMDDIVRNKIFYFNKNEYNIKKIIDEACKPFTDNIVDNLINLSNDQLGTMQKILLTGGGANIIFELMRKNIGNIIDVEIMKDAEFGNAEGYYKYGVLLQKNNMF